MMCLVKGSTPVCVIHTPVPMAKCNTNGWGNCSFFRCLHVEVSYDGEIMGAHGTFVFLTAVLGMSSIQKEVQESAELVCS